MVTLDDAYVLSPALVFDNRDRPHIVYYDYFEAGLKYATRAPRGEEWTLAMIDASGNVGYQPDVATDAEGNLHVSYYDATHGELKYAVGR